LLVGHIVRRCDEGDRVLAITRNRPRLATDGHPRQFAEVWLQQDRRALTRDGRQNAIISERDETFDADSDPTPLHDRAARDMERNDLAGSGAAYEYGPYAELPVVEVPLVREHIVRVVRVERAVGRKLHGLADRRLPGARGRARHGRKGTRKRDARRHQKQHRGENSYAMRQQAVHPRSCPQGAESITRRDARGGLRSCYQRPMRTATVFPASVLALALVACSSSLPPPEDAPVPDDAGRLDAGGGDLDTPTMTDAGSTGDTWSSFAETFMQTYCVRCHSASPRDFRLLADVRANAVNARCGVSGTALSDCGSGPPPRQFPVGSGPFPSDDERARLVAWFDAGAPE